MSSAARLRGALEQIDRLPDHRAEYAGIVKQIVINALTDQIGGTMTTGLPKRIHLDTIEYRIYTDDRNNIDGEKVMDAVADAVNVALEQLKRDLAKYGLMVEADF